MAEFIFQGPLAENPLPEVLQKIHYYKVPGVLRVSRADGFKQVFISGGEIIFATSSYPGDRLGEFLLDRARITQEQYDLSVARMKETGRRQGAVLVEAGILTAQELYETVKEQVMAIVWSLFDWTEGEITFKVGKFREDEVIKLSLDTRAAILRGIKGMRDPKRVVKWLGRKEEVFEPTDHALALLPSLPLTAEDRLVFRLVDGQRTLLEILRTSTADSGTTAKILYALYILGLVRRRDTALRITVPTSRRT